MIWPGSKRRLLPQIRERYPEGLGTSIKKYAEPFVGGGSVMLDLLSSYSFDEVYISDNNKDIIGTYIAIRDHMDDLEMQMNRYRDEYFLLDEKQKRDYYYAVVRRYNSAEVREPNSTEPHEKQSIERVGMFLFLIYSCFNGVYRVNKKNEFNQSHGCPKKWDMNKFRNISEALKNVDIVLGDYKQVDGFVDQNTFVYMDPPYRPISNTETFTYYTAERFTEEDQIELAQFANNLSKRGAKILLSNSDPKNTDPNDDFFEKHYQEMKIERVQINRNIAGKVTKRKTITELLVRNYGVE